MLLGLREAGRAGLEAEEWQASVEEAARRAEEAAVGVLSRFLGPRSSDFLVVVKVAREGGATRVLVDIRALAAKGLDKEYVEAVVEEAVRAARRAVEEVLRRRGRSGPREGGRETEGV